MNKPKVLIVQERLMHYRLATYEVIARYMDLTLGYLLKNDIKETDIPIIKLPTTKIGKAFYNKHQNRIFNQYDVVIILPHFKFVRMMLTPFLPHKYKLITWSIGIKATYDRPYDLEHDPDILGRIFGEIIRRSDAAIFYMPQPIDYWCKRIKLDRQKCFVAHNTVPVAPFEALPDYSSRDSILFVGTLYKQKGIGVLLNAYAEAYKEEHGIPKLVIVGDGPEKEDIVKTIAQQGIAHKVELLGALYDENRLKDIHLSACLCVSPNQAGLSVLKSLGYGVPFVTREDAVTGGERLNVKDGYNGVLYKEDRELKGILLDMYRNADKYARMAENARNYYLTEASVEQMAQGCIDAVNFVMNNK